jgi:hypothetical protein
MGSTDPESAEIESGFSLANFAEIVFPCLDAVAPDCVVEVGAYEGDFTEALLRWASGSGARVIAIEPSPPPELLELQRRHPDLELVGDVSLEAIPRIPPPGAVLIDGDHNYYTVSGELRLIEERAQGTGMPLVMFHDVCWPHARRDTYYEPERIPEEHRQPMAHDVAVSPGEAGVTWAGMRYEWAAVREGGPRNGVLTAIEDFVEPREELRLAVVPAFFGLGVLWRKDAPWAEAVAEIVDPWDRNPILERLESNRIGHIVDRVVAQEQHALLDSLLHSRAFAWAEWLSRIRQRGEPVLSREKVRRVLGGDRRPTGGGEVS